MTGRISDAALAVFTFAAYHQLTSGKPVLEVVLKDAAGHSANQGAIEELQASGLLTASGERGAFTESGQAVLGKVIDSLQSVAASLAESPAKNPVGG